MRPLVAHKKRTALALWASVSVHGIVGCDATPCSPGERRLGSGCIKLDEGDGEDPDASVTGGTSNEDADAGPRPTHGGAAAAQNPDRLTFDCRVVGHCAEWPMPDPLGKAHPAYRVEPEIVVDTITGLAWQRRVVNGNCNDGNPVCTSEQIESYCSGLNLGGIAEWRVPSAVELQSIFVLDGSMYVFDPMLFPNGAPVGTLIATKPLAQLGREVLFSTAGGLGLEGSRLKGPQVRCVAGGLKAQGPRYSVDVANGLVSDNWTTLTWRRSEEEGLFDYEGAKRQCANLGDGWRLPTAKELLTLVTPSHLQRCIDERAFPAPVSEELWSSSAYEGSDRNRQQTGFQLSLDMTVLDDYRCGNIRANEAVKHSRFSVRCVR